MTSSPQDRPPLASTRSAVDTHCPYCALQCAMRLSPAAESGGPVVVAGRDFPTNRGGLCQKGWTAAEVLSVPDRLTTPLVRDAEGVLRPATWDAAYHRIAADVQRIQAAHGPDAVAVFGGGGLTNEKAYQLGKLARVALRTRNIDYNGRFCMSSAAAATNAALGLDRGLPFPVTDIDRATVVLLAGSNVAETMPPFVQHLAGARAAGGLIVIDPRRSATATLTDDGAGLHLQPVPGTDIPLLMAILQHVVTLGGLDRDYLARRVTGWEQAVEATTQWWPEAAERVTGVPAPDIRRAAELLVTASRQRDGAYVLTGRGAEQHDDGTQTVRAAINLALALGLPGRPGSGYGALTGQGNGQGGREHGQKSDQLPGYRSISDPAARQHVAAVWGVDPETLPGPGVPAMRLLRSLATPDGPKAMFVHGSNLAVAAPDAGAIRQTLAALELLVVCDIVPSETALLADVVLPVGQWAEEDGTMTTLEGRVVRRRAAIDAPDGVRDELQVIAELAELVGSPVPFASSPSEVFDELARASAGGTADYSGLSYRRLDDTEPAYWPAADPGGSPRLFLDRFATADGRARMVATTPQSRVLGPGEVWLTTGRILQHYQSGAQTRRVGELNRAARSVFVQIHPLTAGRLEIDEGDVVEVLTEHGAALGRARLSYDTRPDTVFMPFHFPGRQSANNLTSGRTDPTSGMPEFKTARAVVRRADLEAGTVATAATGVAR